MDWEGVFTGGGVKEPVEEGGPNSNGTWSTLTSLPQPLSLSPRTYASEITN